MQQTSGTFDSESLSPNETCRPAATALAQQPRLLITSNLNILRSTAVSLVLLNHVLRIWGLKHGILSFHDEFARCLGRLGVLLFFVHTSLVLSFSLERIGSRGWQLFRTFLVRRAFRLYPLSIVCILVIFAFQIPSMPYRRFVPYSWGGWLSNLALTTDLTGTAPAPDSRTGRPGRREFPRAAVSSTARRLFDTIAPSLQAGRHGPAILLPFGT